METSTEFAKIASQDIKDIKFTEYALSDLAKKEVANWTKFKDLDVEIENLKNGSISFFKDDKLKLE